MEKILGGVAVCGIVAIIALGAREELPRGSASPTLPHTVFPQRPGLPGPASAPVTPAGPARVAAQAGTDSPAPAAPAAPIAPAAERAGSGGGNGAGTALPPPVAVAESASAQGDAQALLRAAEQAYGRVRTVRADFAQVITNPLLGTTTRSRGTLFERRPDRFLMRFSDPAGDVLVSDGQHFWVYYPSVDPKQVIRMPATAGRGGADLQAQFLGDAGRRFQPTLEGTATVGGKRLSLLRLVPRASAPYKQLKLWIDPADHLARRIEITEENGNVRRVDLSNLRVNTAVSDAVFRFRPPAGAQVVDRS
jgi:outer membrane lipoprotein carrier protein